MTTLTITLPDELAREAQRAGLLSPELLESWLRQQLKARRVNQLLDVMNRAAAEDNSAAMSPEQVTEEIAAMRAERRARSRTQCGLCWTRTS